MARTEVQVAPPSTPRWHEVALIAHCPRKWTRRKVFACVSRFLRDILHVQGRFVHPQRVEFSDTDMAGIVHFPQFFRYMERAEHAYFRSLGLSVVDSPPDSEACVGWPRVHASCDYSAPLVFEEEFTVELLVEEIRARSLRYLFRFWKKDETLAATARMSVVCVARKGGSGGFHAVEIPARIREKLSVAPPELISSRDFQ